MSKLKAHRILGMNEECACIENDFYLKSEADKVIAELENRIDDGDKDFEMADHQNERLLKIVRHQKYKRCLAMADFCESQYDYYNTLGNGFWLVRGDVKKRDEYRKKSSDFWWKWHKRWLKIAEQFKEAK